MAAGMRLLNSRLLLTIEPNPVWTQQLKAGEKSGHRLHAGIGKVDSSTESEY